MCAADAHAHGGRCRERGEAEKQCGVCLSGRQKPSLHTLLDIRVDGKGGCKFAMGELAEALVVKEVDFARSLGKRSRKWTGRVVLGCKVGNERRGCNKAGKGRVSATLRWK